MINLAQPKATVAILTKNAGAQLKGVLDAVRRQRTEWPFEVLVIDSGSSDGTLNLLGNYPEIRVHKIAPRDFGHGRTRNLAIKLSKGDFVALLTHDATPANDHWLQNLVGAFDGDERIAGVFGRHQAYDGALPYTKRDLKLHFDHFLSWPRVLQIDDKQRWAADRGYRQVLHFFSDNNACVRKSIWKNLPYPEVDFAEDQLWALKFLEAGYSKAYADDSVVYHSHDYTIRDTFRRSFDESRALKRLFGYILCPSLIHGIYQTYACSYRDLSYLKSLPEAEAPWRLKARTPMLHIARQIGWFLGGYQGYGSALLFKTFSLDDAKRRG